MFLYQPDAQASESLFFFTSPTRKRVNLFFLHKPDAQASESLFCFTSPTRKRVNLFVTYDLSRHDFIKTRNKTIHSLALRACRIKDDSFQNDNFAKQHIYDSCYDQYGGQCPPYKEKARFNKGVRGARQGLCWPGPVPHCRKSGKGDERARDVQTGSVGRDSSRWFRTRSTRGRELRRRRQPSEPRRPRRPRREPSWRRPSLRDARPWRPWPRRESPCRPGTAP